MMQGGLAECNPPYCFGIFGSVDLEVQYLSTLSGADVMEHIAQAINPEEFLEIAFKISRFYREQPAISSRIGEDESRLLFQTRLYHLDGA